MKIFFWLSRRVYTWLFYLITPLIVIRLLWKGRHLSSEYIQRIPERFGRPRHHLQPVDIWLHAVSLGEVNAAIPLIDALLKQDKRIFITTTTETGSKRVSTYFKTKVQHQYLPYDLPCVLRYFLTRISPRIVIIMETEIWPNLIAEVQRRGIPLLLANARISDKAYRRYQSFSWFFKPMLAQFTRILAQSEEDRLKFITLGASETATYSTGNLKFDVPAMTAKDNSLIHLKKFWGDTRCVFIAASTHDDEEAQILHQLTHLQTLIPNVLLLIAPRHPERFRQIAQMSQQLGFNTQCRSNFTQRNESVQVLIIDSLGELLSFYQLSDYAFVGGSLVPIGGHNVLEPVSVGTPVLSGPYVSNTKAIFESLQSAGAIRMVDSAEELVQAIDDLYQNPVQRLEQVHAAEKVVSLNRGALSRHLSAITQLMT